MRAVAALFGLKVSIEIIDVSRSAGYRGERTERSERIINNSKETAPFTIKFYSLGKLAVSLRSALGLLERRHGSIFRASSGSLANDYIQGSRMVTISCSDGLRDVLTNIKRGIETFELSYSWQLNLRNVGSFHGSRAFNADMF